MSSKAAPKSPPTPPKAPPLPPLPATLEIPWKDEQRLHDLATADRETFARMRLWWLTTADRRLLLTLLVEGRLHLDLIESGEQFQSARRRERTKGGDVELHTLEAMAEVCPPAKDIETLSPLEEAKIDRLLRQWKPESWPASSN